MNNKASSGSVHCYPKWLVLAVSNSTSSLKSMGLVGGIVETAVTATVVVLFSVSLFLQIRSCLPIHLPYIYRVRTDCAIYMNTCPGKIQLNSLLNLQLINISQPLICYKVLSSFLLDPNLLGNLPLPWDTSHASSCALQPQTRNMGSHHFGTSCRGEMHCFGICWDAFL